MRLFPSGNSRFYFLLFKLDCSISALEAGRMTLLGEYLQLT